MWQNHLSDDSLVWPSWTVVADINPQLLANTRFINIVNILSVHSKPQAILLNKISIAFMFKIITFKNEETILPQWFPQFDVIFLILEWHFA